MNWNKIKQKYPKVFNGLKQEYNLYEVDIDGKLTLFELHQGNLSSIPSSYIDRYLEDNGIIRGNTSVKKAFKEINERVFISDTIAESKRKIKKEDHINILRSYSVDIGNEVKNHGTSIRILNETGDSVFVVGFNSEQAIAVAKSLKRHAKILDPQPIDKKKEINSTPFCPECFSVHIIKANVTNKCLQCEHEWHP